MQNARLNEAQAGIKTAGRNINNLRYADDTTLIGRKWRRTKEPLDESERGEWKSWLKVQHSENIDHGIQSHHFMANRWINNGNSGRLYFWGGSFKITADGGCSHEIKRRLLLGREAETNLDSLPKSRDITLPTKVHLVKAMVFPVGRYGCESWTMKKAERQIIDTFRLWCWRRLLWVPWTARRSNQLIPKEINPDYSLKGLLLKLKLQYFGHLIQRVDSLEETLIKIEDRRRSGWTEDEMVGWHHRLDGRGFEWTPGVGDGQGGLACCGSWGHKELDMSERLNWYCIGVFHSDLLHSIIGSSFIHLIRTDSNVFLFMAE